MFLVREPSDSCLHLNKTIHCVFIQKNIYLDEKINPKYKYFGFIVRNHNIDTMIYQSISGMIV